MSPFNSSCPRSLKDLGRVCRKMRAAMSQDTTKLACRRIAAMLLQSVSVDDEELGRLKLQVASEMKLPRIPSNSEVLSVVEDDQRENVRRILTRKKVRTLSGVSVVAVMTEPLPCPHGRCSYCPGGPAEKVPQSYTGFEPAAMRGVQHGFNPFSQVSSRIDQLRAVGHQVDKVELIIMGGTFPSASAEYQEWFVKRCLDAITGRRSVDLDHAKGNAEVGFRKNVGITVETRPDCAGEKQVDQMLRMGVTRVELGVQNLYDDIYRLVDRGHTVEDVARAFQVVRDAGLKVVAHMMPGLPGSSFERDLDGFRKLFRDPRFKPDMLKIYPCLVIKGTKLHGAWRRGEYSPLSNEAAAELVAEVKRITPPWVRIMRVQRDIPANLIEAGVTAGNLRELARRKLREEGVRCRCIRCREVGHRHLVDRVDPDPGRIGIYETSYEASEGVEVFVSAEDRERDVLIGYLRLRIPSSSAHRHEVRGEGTSIVRELRILGPLVPVGMPPDGRWQHRGYGEALLHQAEAISVEVYGRRKILVTSALGTKRYYMRRGYSYDGPYMSKWLT